MIHQLRRTLEVIDRANRDPEFIRFRERNSRSLLLVMTVVGVIIVMGFAPLDSVLGMRRADELLILRIATSVLFLLNLGISRMGFERRRATIHFFIGFYICAISASFQALLAGGITSSYWTGITYLLIFWLTLVPFPFKVLVWHSLIFIVQYTAIILLLDNSPINWPGVLSCNFHILATFIIGAPVAFINNRSAATIFYNEKTIIEEREKIESLLLNILPAPIAERLKAGEVMIADRFDNVTVVFSDIVGYTRLSAQLAPERLVEYLNVIFDQFDALTEKYGLEKIETVGDAYLAVCGLPIPCGDHAQRAAMMALDMQKVMNAFRTREGDQISIRLGFHSGPVVGGVIGHKKFAYRIWGDTVNTASRMESNGVPGRIQCTETTYALLRGEFVFEDRGEIEVKGKGAMRTYFLVDVKPATLRGDGTPPTVNMAGNQPLPDIAS
jgi:class 3 adenylate cyclase